MTTGALRLLVLILVFASIPVFCSVLIPPDEFYIAGMVSLLIPLFTLADLFAICYFVIKRSYWSLLPLVVLIPAFPLLWRSFSFDTASPIRQPRLTVVSYNVNSLNLFTHPARFASNQLAFREWVAANKFDIVCLQEMIEVEKVPYEIPSYEKTSSVKLTGEDHHLGLFTFSRFPVLSQGELELAVNSYNRLMWTDILVDSDTIRVINVHLGSYEFSETSIPGNLTKVRSAVIARGWHTKLITQFVNGSPHPVILCGDFNETPQSWSYRELVSILNDTFSGSATGYSYTYRFKWLPLRIDHIFTSPYLQTSGYQVVHQVNWSDHWPVLVRIGWQDRGG